MTEQELINLFRMLNSDSIDAEGIKIPNAVAIKDEKQIIAGMAICGPDAGVDYYKAVARILVAERPDQFIFGMDRFTKPGQGIETDSCLSVHYWNGEAWRFGVIPYQFDPHFFGEIDWDNSFWCGPFGALAIEMGSSWKSIKAAPHRQPSPAMDRPLRVQGVAVCG